MNTNINSERLVDTMAQMFLRQERQPRAAGAGEARPYSIAISRDSGANGHLIAHAVGARLDWRVYDKELLTRIAGEMGLRTRLLEHLDEKQANWLQDALAGFSSAATVDSGVYAHRLVETLLSLAALGECVILGRGAAQVLPADTTLRVRLIAPLTDRIATVQRRLGVAWAEAKRFVGQTDHDRTQFVAVNFQKDPTDHCNYDLTLNTARLGVEDCAELIEETLLRIKARSRIRAAACAAT